MLNQPTANLQVNNTQVTQDNTYLTSDPQGFDTLQEPFPLEGAAFPTTPSNEVQVSHSTTAKKMYPMSICNWLNVMGT